MLPVCARSQTISPGEHASRSFGALTVRYDVAPGEERIRVTMTMRGDVVDQFVLDSDHLDRRFTVVVGGDRASGALRVRFAAAPQLSDLDGSFSVVSRVRSFRFQGVLATWLLSDSVIALTRTYVLTAGLSVKTTILGPYRNAARVDFYAGSTFMGSLTVTQASPRAVLPSDLTIGTTKVASGATLLLTIPTERQSGQLLLQAQISSYGIPETRFSSDIATWPI